MNIDITTIKTENGIHHDFIIKYNSINNESIHNFHLFCLSVVQDLVSNKMKFNEMDVPFTYDFGLDDEEIENIEILINYLAQVVVKEKFGFENELNNLLK